MTEPALDQPWRIIRQDDNGNRYLVGRHWTREEAERVIARLEAVLSRVMLDVLASVDA